MEQENIRKKYGDNALLGGMERLLRMASVYMVDGMNGTKKRIILRDGVCAVVMRYEKWFETGFGTTKVRIIHRTPKKLFERGKGELAWH